MLEATMARDRLILGHGSGWLMAHEGDFVWGNDRMQAYVFDDRDLLEQFIETNPVCNQPQSSYDIIDLCSLVTTGNYGHPYWIFAIDIPFPLLGDHIESAGAHMLGILELANLQCAANPAVHEGDFMMILPSIMGEPQNFYINVLLSRGGLQKLGQIMEAIHQVR